MIPVNKKPILLVDDEPDFLQSLALTLKLAGLTNLTECTDSRKVKGLLAEKNFSLAIIDLVMPHIPGEELLEFIRQNYPQLPILVLTGMNQVDLAVKCIKAGAFDYYVKTTEPERLISGIMRALTTTDLQQQYSELKSSLLKGELRNPEAFANIVTRSTRMQMIFRYLEAIAGSPEPVLVTGESGVGKELFAKAIYLLAKSDAPWVAVNVAGLDDTVFSDTLFGHERGAFTGADNRRPGMLEEASGGILFLDEIGDLTQESQVKLLRLLQEREYFPLGSDKPKRTDARIIVATNHNLEERQATGEFRKDLYYRLCTHQIEIPPLRERKEDIPLLFEAFLQEASEKLGKKTPHYPQELLTLLSLYDFPGNVRQLRAMIYDAVSLHQGKIMSMDSFRKTIEAESAMPPDISDLKAKEPLLGFFQTLPTLKQASELLIEEALKRTDGNQAMAARLLGISPPSLSSRLKKKKTLG